MSLLAPARAAVWSGVLIGLGALVRAITVGVVPASVPQPVARAAADSAPAVTWGDPDSLAGFATSRDPFRRSRRPGPSAGTLPSRGPNVASVPKPTLRLVGVLEGANPTAVIVGFPGARGARVVSPGDVVGALKVERITSAEVRLSGMDTTWALTLENKP